MRWIGKGVAGVVLLLAWGGPAQAQVAAPSFFPGIAVSTSPAVLGWKASSHLVLGGRETDRASFNAAGAQSVATEGEGQFVSGALVTDLVSLGVQVDQSSRDNQFLLLGTTSTGESDTTRAALAFDLWERLALGVSRVDIFTELDTGATNEVVIDLAGASLRLGNVYLGYATGPEEIKNVNDDRFERDRNVYGIAYHLREGDWGLHAEVFALEREPIFDDQTVPGVLRIRAESEQTTTVLEVLYRNLLLRGLVTEQTITNAFNATENDVESTSIGLAWAPLSGFTASVLSSTVEQNVSTGARVEADTVEVRLGYNFAL